MTLSVSVDGSETALIEQCGAHIGEDTVSSSESVPALRFQKNTLAHLPVEILANIFMYIVSEEESYMGVSNPRGAPACLAATHVCTLQALARNRPRVLDSLGIYRWRLCSVASHHAGEVEESCPGRHLQ